MLRTFLRLLLLTILGLAVVSVAWVALYRLLPPPGSLLMLIRLAEGAPGIDRDWQPLERMAPALVHAVIAAEDSRFCSHSGIDWQALDAALDHNRRGRSMRGASTISMQVAKNAFLWPDRTWLRKGAELWFTLWVELLWPKRRILEVYLNLAEWGDGTYGAAAASARWFGKPASALTTAEAARLAAVLPNPRRWNPATPGRYVQQRAAVIAGRAALVRSQGLAACLGPLG